MPSQPVKAKAAPRSEKSMERQVDPRVLLDLTQLAFYRRHFGTLLFAILALSLGTMLLAGGFLWSKNQQVDRQYFSVEQGTGRLTRIVPLSEPHLQGASLLTWVQTCTTQANTYDFVNYQAQFMRNKECFTPKGWEQFQLAMDRAGTLQTVRDSRLVASAVADGAPVILQEGLSQVGAYAWMIQLPITITYSGGESGRGTRTQHLLVKVLVVNTPTWQSREGVGIAQYVASEQH